MSKVRLSLSAFQCEVVDHYMGVDHMYYEEQEGYSSIRKALGLEDAVYPQNNEEHDACDLHPILWGAREWLGNLARGVRLDPPISVWKKGYGRHITVYQTYKARTRIVPDNYILAVAWLLEDIIDGSTMLNNGEGAAEDWGIEDELAWAILEKSTNAFWRKVEQLRESQEEQS